MKNVVFSFLFFIVSYHAFCNIKYTVLQKIDSLEYYSSIVNKPESSISLANAYKFFNKRKDECIKKFDTINTISHLRQLAIIQNELGDYYGCETSIVQALKLLKGLKEDKFTTESKVGLYNQLGRVNTVLLNYNTSLNYFKKGLKLAKRTDHINIIQNNMALVYIEQLNFISAEKLLLEVYEKSVLQGNEEQTARALDNLGFVQAKLSRPIALDNLLKALGMRLEINDNYGIYSSYKHLKIYYHEKGDVTNARSYAKLAYEVAKSVNSLAYLEDALSNIISLSSDPEVLEYRQLKDSIANSKQMADNKYALIKYNYLQKENEAKQNELKFKDSQIQAQKERFNKTIYKILVLFGFIITIFLYFILKSKHKKEKLQEVYITESRISKKVHDEVANDVYHIMTKLQNHENVTEHILDDLEHVYLKTRDISKENSVIDVNENYSELLNDLLLSYKTDTISIITQNISKINWDNLSDLKKMTLFRVLQELMTNMRKHSKATLVALTFKSNSNKIIISYKDNGIGCNLVKHNGLYNTENRMASVNGTITFESEKDNGFNVKITI